MKLFACSNCGQPVYFDNRYCVACGSQLGFLPAQTAIYAGNPSGDGTWQCAALPGQRLRFCDNARIDVCNWLLTDAERGPFCAACRHNRIVPAVSQPGLRRWQRIAQAQRHLFYSLIRLNLPRPDREEDPQGGLVFDFLADEVGADGEVVPAMTRHEEGLISLRAAEADDETRESIRVSMNEPYRTLLGHFRHEIGHFYWPRLVRDEPTLAEARALFGDEREDYAEALRRNYENGPPADWQERFISSYASSHPAEDFAECWAHCLHIVDTLETARAFGLSIDPRHHEEMAAEVDFDPYTVREAQVLVDSWIPLSVALNAVQRSMGQPDSYPFVLSPPVVEKLDFVINLVHGARRS
ncbi:putative zinc-binding peptidase [Sinorhizobium numidicum]|uniref:Zinc-binding peptidase n=1 Tax=Sinorhizobium numidicum TaxID=680248 RepID=A0ABY8D208_9HYPH|nr:putative zinc-binding metallopeptidase [Sinorhizobium numidicum]WEX78262.1 putative zinc-binding peptidase [Sinorhizobium numidicum]WEX84921.1 putative zinc-binding peptidase [Sinorhizobium numidicum]